MLLLLACVLAAGSAFANSPPALPDVTEPRIGRIVNAQDLHMETAPFSDPDSGDTHLCSDWEVWTAGFGARVWYKDCALDVNRVHIHLGDGTFDGPLTGRRDLDPATDYLVRVRHRDSSGDSATEYSDWAQRDFSTGPATTIFAMVVRDALAAPAPQLLTAAGAPLDLPDQATTGEIIVGHPDGMELLHWSPQAGPGNALTNPPALEEHMPVVVTVTAGAGDSPFPLPSCVIVFTSDDGAEHSIYLPPLAVEPGASVTFWASATP